MKATIVFKKDLISVRPYLRSGGGGLKIFTGTDCDSGGHTVLLICQKKKVNLFMQRKDQNSPSVRTK